MPRKTGLPLPRSERLAESFNEAAARCRGKPDWLPPGRMPTTRLQ